MGPGTSPATGPHRSNWWRVCETLNLARPRLTAAAHRGNKSPSTSHEIAAAYRDLLQKLYGLDASQQSLPNSANDSSAEVHDSFADSQQHHGHSQQARSFHAQPMGTSIPAGVATQQLPLHLHPQLPWEQELHSTQPSEMDFGQHGIPFSAPLSGSDADDSDFIAHRSASQNRLHIQQQLQQQLPGRVGPIRLGPLERSLEQAVCKIGWETFMKLINRRDVMPAWDIIEAMRQVWPDQDIASLLISNQTTQDSYDAFGRVYWSQIPSYLLGTPAHILQGNSTFVLRCRVTAMNGDAFGSFDYISSLFMFAPT